MWPEKVGQHASALSVGAAHQHRLQRLKNRTGPESLLRLLLTTNFLLLFTTNSSNDDPILAVHQMTLIVEPIMGARLR
jgi:hypothetical protein